MKDRVKKAVLNYARLREFEYIDELEDEPIMFFFDEAENSIVVAKYGWSTKGWTTPSMSRKEFEEVALKFFMSHIDMVDVCIRHDIIDVHVIRDDRAFIRHHVDILKEGFDVDIR